MLARELRRSGYAIELSSEGKLKRAMELANKTGARHVLIVGDDEITAGEYALKNMQSGEQIKVTRAEIEQRIGQSSP